MQLRKITFDRLGEERILHITRKHVVYIFFRHMIHLFTLFALCILVFLIGWAFHPLAGIVGSLVLFSIAGLYVAMLYYGTYLLITTHRIISSRRQGFFHFHTRELRVSDLKETMADSRNIFEAIFRYGDISIYGMDHEEMIHFRGVPHASKVHRYISKVIELYHGHNHANPIEKFDR